MQQLPLNRCNRAFQHRTLVEGDNRQINKQKPCIHHEDECLAFGTEINADSVKSQCERKVTEDGPDRIRDKYLAMYDDWRDASTWPLSSRKI